MQQAQQKRDVHSKSGKSDDYLPPGVPLTFIMDPSHPVVEDQDVVMTQPLNKQLESHSESVLAASMSSQTDISVTSSANQADQLRGGNPVNSRPRGSGAHEPTGESLGSPVSLSRTRSTAADQTI